MGPLSNRYHAAPLFSGPSRPLGRNPSGLLALAPPHLRIANRASSLVLGLITIAVLDPWLFSLGQLVILPRPVGSSQRGPPKKG